MRKIIISLVLLSLLTVSMAGCFGNFSLTRKVYTWNASLGNKVVESLVMWVFMIIPVYQVVGFVDVAILNLIEFWTDTNPLAMNETDVEIRQYATEDTVYEVVTTQNRYDVFDTQNAENHFAFVFDSVNMAWNLEINNTSTQITQGL